MATASIMRTARETEVSPESRPAVQVVAPPAAPVAAIGPVLAPSAQPKAAVALTPAQRLGGALRRQLPGALLGFVSIAALVVFWYLATKYRWSFYIRFTNIPAPGEVYTEAVKLFGDPKFMLNIGISLRRIMFGFLIATGLGVALGLLCGRYMMFKGSVFPALEILRPIPAIAWVPMSIMLWPTTESSIVFITFIGAFFPILLNTMHGVAAVDKVLVRAARCLGASEFALMTQVILRGAMPHIFTGLAVGMGVAWVSLIAAEMISGQFGVGYFTWEAYSLIEYSHIVIGMLVIGVLGLMCSGAIRLLAKLSMPWQSIGGAKEN